MDSAIGATLSPVPLLGPDDWNTDRPGIYPGVLNAMPHNLIYAILADLSIDDIASVAATNVSTFVAYITAPADTTPLSCRDVVRAIRFARANKDDEVATTRALTRITCQNVQMRPRLLAQVAQAFPGMVAPQDGALHSAWENACTDARNAWRLRFHAEMPAVPYHPFALADWRDCVCTDQYMKRVLNTAGLQKMAALPSALLPEVLQAFVKQGVSLPGKVLVRLIDTVQGRLFGISDLFANELAIALFNDEDRRHIKSTLSRLGVSDRQLARVVMPRVAAIVADSVISGHGSQIRASIRWDPDDDYFIEALDKAYTRRLEIDSD